jgi:hypothetical protein
VAKYALHYNISKSPTDRITHHHQHHPQRTIITYQVVRAAAYHHDIVTAMSARQYHV